jgi:phospholipid transport system substrate-binding protein
MKRSLVPASFLIGLLSICPAAQATSPTEQLRGFFSAATRILDSQTDEGVEARMAAIRAIVKEIVDVPAAAQLSLGPNWSVRTAAERDEFVQLFADLLERSLISAIAGRDPSPRRRQVSYLGESVGEPWPPVWTTILTKRGMDLPFTYRMKARAGGWAIRDVVIDGVSVAANYRAQFLRIMQVSSYQELVRQMRARVPETLTRSLVATAIAEGPAIASGTPPTQPSDPVRAAVQEPAPPPAPAPGPPVNEVATSARSDVRLQLELEMAVVSRALAEATVLPTNAGGRAAGDSGAPIASRRDARSQPRRWGGGAVRARRERQVLLGAGPAPSRHRGRPGAWLHCSSRRSLPARADLQPSRVVGRGPLLTRVRVGPFSDRSRKQPPKLREMEARGYKPFIAAEASDGLDPVIGARRQGRPRRGPHPGPSSASCGLFII